MSNEPTDEDRGIDLAAWLAECDDRLRKGWDDLPTFASPARCLASVCRRAIAAEAEADRLRKMVEKLTERVVGQSELLSRRAETPSGTTYTHDVPREIDALASRLKQCDGRQSDACVIVWEQCQLLAAELERGRGETPETPSAPPLTFLYRNHRGEVAWRSVRPKRIYHGVSEYHAGGQWLMDGWDEERKADRTFALRDVVEWGRGEVGG